MNEEKIRRAQGARLKAAREMAGFRSARDAALQNDWKESSYRAHENGTRTIGRDDADRYAKRFNTTAQRILFGDGPTSDLDTLMKRLEGLTPERRASFIQAMLGVLDAGALQEPDRAPDEQAG